jgi:signal transduction histidine kinase
MKKEFKKISQGLIASSTFIRDYMMLVKGFTAALTGDEKQFRQKTIIDPKKDLDFYLEKMRTLFQRYNIIVRNELPDNQYLYMYKADFQSIIFNLFSNSLKAIVKLRTKKKLKSNNKNYIKIYADQTLMTPSKYISIVFSDDGTGVRQGIQDRIFDLFISDYNPEDDKLRGSGLGLTLLREITQNYDGDIKLVKSDFNPGASFCFYFDRKSVKIPDSVKLKKPVKKTSKKPVKKTRKKPSRKKTR